MVAVVYLLRVQTQPLLFLCPFLKHVCLMLELSSYGQIMGKAEGKADGIRKPLMGLGTQLPS